MHDIGAGEIRSVLHYRMLIERLRQCFRSGGNTPLPSRHRIETYGKSDAALTLEASWHAGRVIGVKVETDFPDNFERDLPTRSGRYLLLDGKTGIVRAVLDASALITRRAAGTSALAASYLARADAERLLVVGTGTLALNLIEAYAVVRPIRQVLVWGRRFAEAERVAGRFRRCPFTVTATNDLEGAVRGAHIVTCATAAREPVVRGAWLAPGVHVDLTGSTTPDAREADDDVVRQGRVFVDTRDGACRNAGDIVQPLASGALATTDIAGDLFELTRGERSGRRFYDQTTVFKAAGSALGDLATAELATEMVAHNETLR